MFAVILARRDGCSPAEIATSDALIAALAPFTAPDKAGVWCDERALVVQALHHNTPASLHELTPEICMQTGRIIASWVRLDNRAQLCAQLNLDDRPELTDPQIILAAHREWGHDCARKLEGDFSFVILDPKTGQAFCARDTIGVKPFFFVHTDQHFIAASSVAAIKAIKSQSFTPDLDWIALFSSGFGFADSATAYTEISKLRPGHHLRVTRDGHGEPTRYFEFDLEAPHSTVRDPISVERYRDAFDRAVDRRARSHFLIGAENSGGLDSASILARLVDALPDGAEQLHTFSVVAHQQESDLLDELSAMLGQAQEQRQVRPETLRLDHTVDRAIAAIGHPPEHGQPLLSADFFEHAESTGVRTVLSGFGGDEIVTGYAKHLIDELHRRREWRAVFDELEGTPLRRTLRFVRRLVEGPADPTRMLREQYSAKLAVSCLSREFLEDTGLRERIESWMLPDFGEQTVNTIAALSPGFRYGRTGRLEASALFAATYGIEYRFPFFDRQLIQLFLNTPSIEKRRGSMGRFLHRRAIAGRIPDGIAWQQSKDMGPPLDGQFRFADLPRISFGDLPEQLKTVFDPSAFEATQNLVADPPDPMNHTVMRSRYFMWHVSQLCVWLRAP